MSIIFGIRQNGGAFVDERQLLTMGLTTERWAPDGTFVAVSGQVGMGFQLYHTHQRSNFESQPVTDVLGNMIVIDGRLDNHKELRAILNLEDPATPDSKIALAAFSRWGKDCFARFVGDWAVAIWSNLDLSLYLARDHAGSRTLYFHDSGSQLRWCTHLEALSIREGSCVLDRRYAFRYLAGWPTEDLTPYGEVKSISPAHYVVFHGGTLFRSAHWNAVHQDSVRYKNDADYEHHFLSLFRQSVHRRTGSGDPVLAQLSGGMDSSSIVCMSDRIRLEEGASEPPIDTLSFYDTSEPAWDEAPYFTTVERARGKAGIHVDVSQPKEFLDFSAGMYSYVLPGADASSPSKDEYFASLLRNGGYRVILSGIGGDEVLGGVSTPLPELADHLIRCDLKGFFNRAVEWCVPSRQPILHAFGSTARFLLDKYSRQTLVVPPWVKPAEEIEHGRDYRSTWSLLSTGVSPSTVNNGGKWRSLLETTAHSYPGMLVRPEYRYPYLDRDLVEFLFRIPQEQLTRPGCSRSLMKRSLTGIVPHAILARRRKGYLVKGALDIARCLNARLDDWIDNALIVRHGCIDADQFRIAVSVCATKDHTEWLRAIRRTLAFEFWLKNRWAEGGPQNISFV